MFVGITFVFGQATGKDSHLQTKLDSISAVVSGQGNAKNDSTKSIHKNNNKTRTADNGGKLEPIYQYLSTQKFIGAIFIILITYFLIRIINRLLQLIAEKSARYRITVKGLMPLVRIIGWLIALMIIVLGIFKPELATLIAVSASIGVAVGFAAQDILKNIFGGIVIIFDQPFKVGDKIEIGSYYGEVVEIGLRSTRLVTADDSTVSVPNGEIMSKSVSNANSGEPNCQVVAEVYLPINIDTENVRKIATEAAQVSKYVYLKKPIAVLFSQELKERRNYMKMRLKAYVLDIRYEFAFKSEMTERVINALIKEGIMPEN